MKFWQCSQVIIYGKYYQIFINFGKKDFFACKALN